MEEQQGPERVRLFVGGLGPSITASELERAFGSLGAVSGVEFIRSRDRDFAYLDFEAPSPAALHKVFSTYQGCKWKGGCLRVEKAKEDYLTRFKRERELDAIPTTLAHLRAARESTPLPDLKIFFPRSRKIRTVPGSGTGRHKRSFQRFGSQPLALLSLCGCEGHENEAVDLYNYEHEAYLRLVDKLEDKQASEPAEAREQAQPILKTKISTRMITTEPQERAPKMKGSSPVEDQSAGVEDESEEPSDVEGVTLPGLRKRKFKTKDSGDNWDKMFEAASGFKDDETGIEEDDLGAEDIKADKPKQKRVRFVDETPEKADELNSVEPEPGKLESTEAPAEMKPDENKQQGVEHQTEWVQFSSWKALVNGGSSFSLARGSGATSIAAARVVDDDDQKGRKLDESRIEKPRSGESLVKKTQERVRNPGPDLKSLLGKQTCSFMRSSNAEAEWISSKKKLRSDSKARHKNARNFL